MAGLGRDIRRHLPSGAAVGAARDLARLGAAPGRMAVFAGAQPAGARWFRVPHRSPDKTQGAWLGSETNRRLTNPGSLWSCAHGDVAWDRVGRRCGRRFPPWPPTCVAGTRTRWSAPRGRRAAPRSACARPSTPCPKGSSSSTATAATSSGTSATPKSTTGRPTCSNRAPSSRRRCGSASPAATIPTPSAARSNG